MSGDGRESTGKDFNPHRRYAHPNDLVFLQEQVIRQFRNRETKQLQHADKPFGIVGMDGNPHVHIVSCPGIAMICDGVPADQQIFAVPQNLL